MSRQLQKKVSEDEVQTMHSNRKQNLGARIECVFSAVMHEAEQVRQRCGKLLLTNRHNKNTRAHEIITFILIKELQKESLNAF